jgi:selenide,water dikinase
MGDGRAMAVTTDFFTPIVDDPYAYGVIAAANALSDLYAMGATPFLALNIAAMPTNLPLAMIAQILRGGAEKVREAGAVLGGGHTIQDDEPKYGLVALGFLDSDRVLTKEGAQVGDVLILTKPIGTGVSTTAFIRDLISEEELDDVVRWMGHLNASASQLALAYNATAVTDITGFGLLGHAYEVAQASGVGLRLSVSSVPFFKRARAYAELGAFPGGSADNQLYFGAFVHFDSGIDEYTQLMLYDAQTSGGLMFSLPKTQFTGFQSAAEEAGMPFWLIGDVIDGEGIQVVTDEFLDELPFRPPEEPTWFPPSTS